MFSLEIINRGSGKLVPIFNDNPHWKGQTSSSSVTADTLQHFIGVISKAGTKHYTRIHDYLRSFIRADKCARDPLLLLLVFVDLTYLYLRWHSPGAG